MNKPLENLEEPLNRLEGRAVAPAWESATLEMIADRNLTVHTYDRELAGQVFSRLADHHATITSLSSALKSD